jgi:sec-independent protein translocase protein TatB
VFDISLGEMMVCLVVILIVIGPERLPETVRTIALWVGRLKRSIRETRSEIERQIGADDIRRQLYNEEIMRSLEKTRAEMNQGLSGIEQDIRNPLSDLTEEQRKALYSPPEELPDHAHVNEPAPIAEQITESTPAPNPDSPTKV